LVRLLSLCVARASAEDFRCWTRARLRVPSLIMEATALGRSQAAALSIAPAAVFPFAK
jgi:hypothetical protein